MIGQVFKKIIGDGKGPSYEGYIDGYHEGALQGWMRQTGSSSPITVDILIDGKRAHTDVVCDIPRDDMRVAKMGSDVHGFSVPFDLAAYGDIVEVIVRVADSKTQIATTTLKHGDLKAQLRALAQRGQTATKPAQAKGEQPKSKEPATPSYESRIEWTRQSEFRGWMVSRQNIGEIFFADLSVNGTWYCRVRNDVPREDLARRNISGGRGGFEVSIPAGLLKQGTNELSLRMPNGDVRTQSVQATSVPATLPTPKVRMDTSVSIIVPIYNAFEDTEICIARLLQHTTQQARLILINDASPDKKIAPLLKQYANHSNVTVLTNKTNKGFTATINRGIKEAGEDDVIFLNSDARVTPGWLEGLRLAASTDPMIATVTPLSDRAGAFSAPRIGNENKLPFGVGEAEYATAVSRSSLHLYPTVPTGNGFCLYVRRAAINDVGPLDEKAFPRGYGEENDFCMRARAAGWRNIIDDGSYVFHERSKSFGEAKTELMADGRKVVDARHPDYSTAIRVFGSSPKIALARYKAHQAENALRAAKAVLPRALFVTSTQTGGTPQTNRDLMNALSGDWECWLMRCDSKVLTLSRMQQGKLTVVAEHTLQEPVSPTTHTSFEYDQIVAGWLAAHQFELVHIRQLIWHSLTLPKLAKDAGALVVNSFHDFYTLSPSIKLLDEDSVFCGAKCPEGKTYAETDLWPQGSMPALDKTWSDIWQQKFVKALEPCDAFVTTSPSAREMIMSAMPAKAAERFAVIPHGRDFATLQQNLSWPGEEEAIRILVPGNIDLAKGRAVIEGLLDMDEANKRLEFHILGDHDFDGPRRGLIFHGRYERDAFAARVSKIAPHVGAVLSIWDETYCHTLTEMWAVGLPVIGLEYPTVATRIRNSGAGWVYSEKDIAALYEGITRDLGDINGFLEKHKAIIEWQHGEGRANTTRSMASKYQALYQTTNAVVKRAVVPFQAPDAAPVDFASFAKNRVAVVSPASTGQKTAPASTHVRVWARTFNDHERKLSFVRMSPMELVAAVRTGDIDKAIIQRNAIPARVWQALKGLVDAGKLRYVLDLDDDLMNVPADKDPNGAYAAYAPVLRDIIASAAHLTVSTAALGKHLKKINKSQTVVPNLISGRIWRGDLKDRADDGIVRGIYMGNRSHDADFEIVRPAFEALARTYPQLRLRLIGAINQRPEHMPSWLEIVDIPHGVNNYPEFVQWLRGQTDDLDFGIAPLVESPFNTHKSYLKVLDYAGLGLPVLASKHPVYAPLAGPDHVQLVTNTQASWEQALKGLIEDKPFGPDHREAAREWITENHSLEESLGEYDAMLRSQLFAPKA